MAAHLATGGVLFVKLVGVHQDSRPGCAWCLPLFLFGDIIMPKLIEIESLVEGIEVTWIEFEDIEILPPEA